jgi:cell fate regulator YaaT (PSP1 superfamily)
VQFHPLRTSICASATEFDYGDWVIVEADRGIDLGQIISLSRTPAPRDLLSTRSILRKAAARDTDTIPAKQESERAASAFCQAQANDAGLPMEIIGAEYQCDGKKLTFYYTAARYVDFRDLVRTLFRTFGTRIWMVWCDGGEPVRDVLSRKADALGQESDE